MTAQQPGEAVWSTRAWSYFLLGGGVLLVAYALVPEGPFRDGCYVAIGAACVAAIVLGVRLHRPYAAAAWLWMAVGQALWVLGDLLYSFDATSSGSPTPGDFFYLAAYPFLAAGLFRLARSRRSGDDRAGALDGWTVAVGLGLVSYEALARPVVTDPDVTVAATLVAVAYPFGDILLFAALVRLVMTPGSWNRATRLLFTAVLLLLAADTLSAALSQYADVSQGWLDYLWLGSYLAWGAAALHPSMARISARAGEVDPTFRLGRLSAAAAATLVAPTMLAVQAALGLDIDVWAAVVGSVVLYSLVVARMYAAIRQISDVNDQRKELQDQLEFEASHDSMTLLPNRIHGMRLVSRALADRNRTPGTTALLFLDLDGFKHVNDTLGHAAGDQVLRRVAERLRSSVRGDDTAMRLGGDEFVVLLATVVSAEAAMHVAERLVLTIAEPISLGRLGTTRVGASIGVAVCHGREIVAETLLNEADVAAYRAKSEGKGRAELFHESMLGEAADAEALASALAQAVARDQLTAHYQPIINTHTGEVEGFEALVRWDRPGVGMLSPGEFLPVAESSDLICDVDGWMIQHATRQLATWIRELDAPRLTMTVNISTRNAARPRLVADVRRALDSSGIPPHQLVLEMSESVLTDGSRAIRNLTQLRQLGVAISLDDFGSGFGALARLADLPVDIVKIGGRFLDVDSAMSGRLLHLMIQGAHAVGLAAVAQGVEQDRQLATLRSLDCESVQGFHIARPMDAEQAADYHRAQADRFSGLLP